MKARIQELANGKWAGYLGSKRVQTFSTDDFATSKEHASDWLLDRQFEEKVSRFGLGRIVRVTDAARTDMIGRIIEKLPNGKVRVRVPSWQADGYFLDTVVSVHDVEPANIVDLKTSVRNRGW